MPFTRRILHYSPGPANFVGELTDRTATGAWFELHRQRGCGDGEVVVLDNDCSETDVAVGDWIVFENGAGNRWYQGRVIDRRRVGTTAVLLKLSGMATQLDEVFPGGFGRGVADGIPPHRYAMTDEFLFDPDHLDETVDSVDQAVAVVRKVVTQYIVSNTDIVHSPSLIEDPLTTSAIRSLTFRGEEPVSKLLYDLAMRADDASWGVDSAGQFFFLKPPTAVLTTFQQGTDVVSVSAIERRDLVFNRLSLTGGHIYSQPPISGDPVRAFSRWRGHYIQPDSRAIFGDRPIAISLPWVRTQVDSREFAREFFRKYSQLANSYLVETAGTTTLPVPWQGLVRLRDQNGVELYSGLLESIRIQFDNTPRFRLQLGPIDPRSVWPQPLTNERWPVNTVAVAGGLISSG